MADVKYKNKVVYDGEVLIDLTADTITADKLASGITAHDKSGAPVTGTSTKDSDTSNDTAAVAEILKGKTAHAVYSWLARCQITARSRVRFQQKLGRTLSRRAITMALVRCRLTAPNRRKSLRRTSERASPFLA